MASSKHSKDRQLAKAAKRMKRRQQAHQKHESLKRMEGLRQKMQDEGLLDDMALIHNPPGKAKMSDLLKYFAEPYIDSTHNQQQYENLLSMSVLAWNMALLPEEKRQPTLEDILKGVSPEPDFQAFFREFMETMIARKLTYFDQHKRRIIEFYVTDLGDQYHISVASSIE